jgi:hypothetical protein
VAEHAQIVPGNPLVRNSTSHLILNPNKREGELVFLHLANLTLCTATSSQNLNGYSRLLDGDSSADREEYDVYFKILEGII